MKQWQRSTPWGTYRWYVDATLKQHMTLSGLYTGYGLRIISLSVYRGTEWENKNGQTKEKDFGLFAAVWVFRAGPPGPEQVMAPWLEAKDWADVYIDKTHREGYAPILIGGVTLEADGFARHYISTVWEKTDGSCKCPRWPLTGSYAQIDLGHDAFVAQCETAQATRHILRSVAVYGPPSHPRFAGVWSDNYVGSESTVKVPVDDPPKQYFGRVAWSHTIRHDAEEVSTYINAHHKQWVRPSLIVPFPRSKKHHVTWRDDVLPGEWNHVGLELNLAELASAFANAGPSLVPVSIQGAETTYTEVAKSADGGEPPEDIENQKGVPQGPPSQPNTLPRRNFAVIFAMRDTPVERTFRMTALPDPGNGKNYFQLFDNWIRQLLRWYGIRAAQLAIVKDGKLKYAVAYTYAEPSYPDTKVTSVFRIMSMSKPLTALAAIKHFEKHPSFLDARMQNVLQATTIAGGPPTNMTDPSATHFFNDVKVKHLLWHSSGFRRGQDGLPFDETQQTNEVLLAYKHAFKPVPSLPLRHDHFMRYFASFSNSVMVKPGEEVKYSNFDISVLGYMLEKIDNTPNANKTYYHSVRSRVLEPLNIKDRVHVGSAITKLPDEVRYHSAIPQLIRSEMHDDRRLLPHPYGYNMDGGAPAGGWVMAAVDFAKVLAMLDRKGQSLFNQVAFAEMFTAHPHEPTRRRAWVQVDTAEKAKNGKPVVKRLSGGGGSGSVSLGVNYGPEDFSENYSFVLLLNGEFGHGPGPRGAHDTTADPLAEGIDFYHIARSLPAEAWSQAEDLFETDPINSPWD